MSKMKNLLRAAAVMAGLMSIASGASAWDGGTPGGAAFGGTHHNGVWGGSNYGFTVYDKYNTDLWVTWYDGLGGNIQGYGCMGPGQSIKIGSTDFINNGVYLQVEYKPSSNTTCVGGNTKDLRKVGMSATNGATVESGGSSFAVVNGNSSGSINFTQ